MVVRQSVAAGRHFSYDAQLKLSLNAHSMQVSPSVSGARDGKSAQYRTEEPHAWCKLVGTGGAFPLTPWPASRQNLTGTKATSPA